jgi:hypothetical protein
MSTLESQIAALKSRRRSTSEFYEWKPGLFYYPYVPLGALLVYFLTAPPWLGLRTLVTTGLSFGLLCYLPVIANRLRFWVFFRWPNRTIEREIASLQAELDRRIASGGRDA